MRKYDTKSENMTQMVKFLYDTKKLKIWQEKISCHIISPILKKCINIYNLWVYMCVYVCVCVYVCECVCVCVCACLYVFVVVSI